MRISIGIASAMVVCAILFVPTQAKAWGNGGFSADPEHPDYGIHDWIADKALTFQTAGVQFLLTTYHADYLVGTEAPDNGAYIGDSYNHHVYYSSSGAVQDNIGATRAQAMFNLALSSLKSSDFEQGAYYAGAMAHYISDLGAYGHTMGASSAWGTSPHHGDYEDHVQTMLGSLVAPVPSAIALTDAFNATIALAHKTTFGSGTIEPNTWMEVNYDWGNVAFGASCRQSLNESIRAVAQALGLLLLEAGMSSVPEFGSSGVVILALEGVSVALAIRLRR